MLKKKGFMISPILFIIFFLIAVAFSFYVSGIDKKISYGIQKSSMIEKSVYDIEKKQINQITFAEVATYKCSETNCYNSSNSSSINAIKNCTERNLNSTFGNNTNWGYEIQNTSGAFYFKFNMSEFKAISTNMSSNSSTVTKVLNSELLNKC